MNGAAHGDAPSGDRERGDGRSRLANPLASRLSRALEAEQARWLAPLRSRLLRRVDIARRRRVLDLGAGGGTVAEELARRAAGPVVAVDVVAGEPDEADASADAARAVARVTADAVRLPFADGSFELAFCQAALLWMPLAAAAAELRRVVADTGAVLAIEPDFGGMIEHPEGAGLAQVWRAALSRAGADPLVGRKLPGALTCRCTWCQSWSRRRRHGSRCWRGCRSKRTNRERWRTP